MERSHIHVNVLRVSSEISNDRFWSVIVCALIGVGLVSAPAYFSESRIEEHLKLIVAAIDQAHARCFSEVFRLVLTVCDVVGNIREHTVILELLLVNAVTLTSGIVILLELLRE